MSDSRESAPAAPAKPSKSPTDEVVLLARSSPKQDPKPVVYDERTLRFAELKELASQLQVEELMEMLGDGRAIVRANAVLGLAALGQAVPELIPLIRDSDQGVASSAAEALSRLGANVRALVPQIARSLESARPEVSKAIVTVLAELIGVADDDLITAMDVPMDLAMKSVIAASAEAGARGVALMIKAGGNDSIRIRINALCGLEHMGRLDLEPARRFLYKVRTTDPVPDARAAAQRAMRKLGVRGDGSLHTN